MIAVLAKFREATNGTVRYDFLQSESAVSLNDSTSAASQQHPRAETASKALYAQQGLSAAGPQLIKRKSLSSFQGCLRPELGTRKASAS